MPDRKITDLVDGDPLQPTDEFVVARAGDNFKIDGAAVVAAVTKHDVTISGNTAGALAAISSGTMTLAGGNNITLSQAGNAVTISGAAQSVQPETQTFIGGISASDTLYTSGTVRFTGSQAITVRSSTGQLVVIDGPATSSLSATGIVSLSTNGSTISVGAPGYSAGMSTLGNTSGDTGYASQRLNLVGGNNITLSGSTNGGSMSLTISGPNVGGAQTGISGLANSETTYTSGTVSLSELGAITIRSTTGQQFQFSVNPQSVQPETQTFIAGISASDTLYTSGNVRFSGSQAVTVRSGTGQLVIIDVPAQTTQVETQTFIGGISASDTLYTSGTVRFTGVGGGVTVSSNTGQRVDISVAAQSVQPETQTFVAGIGNSQTTYTSGTVNLSVVAGQLTIRSTTGQAFQFSASQSVQPETQTAISGIANSQTTYTSGTVSLSELGAITIRSTTGNQFQFSVNSQTAQTGISGVANSQTTYTSGTVSLSELGAITIRSTTGNQYQFSVNSQTVQTQGILSAGVSTAGNTSGDTTVNTGSRLVFVGTNNITLSQGTAAGATTITISGGAGGAETQTAISGLANSETTYTSGSVTLSALGAITIRSTTGQHFQFSVNSQTVQTQGILNVALSNIGNTSGDTGINSGTRMVLAGGNNVTLSASSAANATTVTISAAAQTVQTQDVLSVGASNLGNTAGNTTVNTGSRLVFVGTNMISLSQTTGAGATTLSINATQSVQTQGILNVALSNIGNTSGDTGLNSGTRMVLAGGNNITLSASTAANATTITISAPNLGAGAMSAGVSNLGNTAGSTGITGTQLVLVGTNMISLSQSTGANGGTVSINATQSVQTQGVPNMGVSTGGATSGNTTVNSGTRFVLVGTNITMSQGTAANATTVTVSAPATSSLSATGNIQISTNGSTISIGDGGVDLDFWDNLVPGASTAIVLSNGALNVYPLNPANAAFPGYMSVSSIFFDVSGTVSTAQPFTRSLSVGFFTRVNSTQLSLMASASTSWGTSAANMNVGDSMAGRRWVTIHSSQFDAAPNFSIDGDYFMAIHERSSSGSQTFSYLGQLLPYHTGIRSGFMNSASATNTTLGQYPFLGNYSATFATGMPSSLAASDINKSNATAVSLPRIIFNNVGSQIV